MKTVSLIIPVCNMQDTLERCLSSAADQTCKGLEILLLDDGSSDRSLEICRRSAAEDGRFRVLSHPNRGVSYTRNRGIRHARGEYLMFADSDDVLAPDMVQRYAEAAEETGADIVVGGIDLVTDGKVRRLLPSQEGPVDQRRFWELAAGEGSGLYGYTPNKLYRTGFIRERGILFRENMKAQEDLDFALRAYGQAEGISLLRYSGYSYYWGGGFRKVPPEDLLGNQLRLYREAAAAGVGSHLLAGLETRLSHMVYGVLFEAGSREDIRKLSEMEGLRDLVSLQGISSREERMSLNWFRKDKEKGILCDFRCRRALKGSIRGKG